MKDIQEGDNLIIFLLLNCAGLAQTGAPMEEMDLKRDWDLLININLNGTFYGMYRDKI